MIHLKIFFTIIFFLAMLIFYLVIVEWLSNLLNLLKINIKLNNNIRK